MLRRSPIAAVLLVLALVLSPAAATAEPATPAPAAADAAWTAVPLGPASVATPTGSGGFIGDMLWFSTRQANPPALIGLDPASGEAVSQIPLPDSLGAWVSAVSGTDVYVGTYTPAKLYRVDTVSGEVEEILTAGGSGAVVYALTVAPDGVVYAGTYESSGGRILAYDPATGAVTDLGVTVPGQDYVRALVADERYLYAGIGSAASLVRIDRATHESIDLTPPDLAGATFVSSLALHEGVLLGGVSPRGQLLVVETADPSRYELVQAPAETFVVAVTGGEPGRAYFAARPSGTLYGYDLWSGTAEALAVPAPEKAASGLTFNDGQVWGLVDGLAYAYDPAGGGVTGLPLDAAGVTPSPEGPMALAADSEHVYVSGSGGVQIHDIARGGSSRVFVPGEAKSLWPTGDTVYLSVYTRALIYELPSTAGPVRQLAEIGHEQTRPRDSFLDDGTGRLYVGTEPDYGRYGGALAVYDTATGELDVYRDIVEDQTISAVAAEGDTVYIGSDIKTGLGTSPVATRAEVAAVDAGTGAVRWSIPAPAGATVVGDLRLIGAELVGLTSTGLLFGLDPATGTLRWQHALGVNASILTPSATGVYTTDGKSILRLTWPEPGAPVVSTVYTGLAGEWYGPASVTATPDGSALFAVQGRTLVRLDVPGELFADVSAASSSAWVGDPDRSRVWRASVTVTVLGADGSPLAGARVTAGWRAGDRPAATTSCVTGGDGSCVLRRTVADAAAVTADVTAVSHPSLPRGAVELSKTVTVTAPERGSR
ncbi:outer membrane protein assembly factor BamB family protein [Jiangella alkaliphila]|uniref:PQQ-like domain-containing protein n=1 Tax=Jiangella alkaliphila TaxID=419479 RepID=A0A1H2KVR7_9ACTN|nr:PQQ-binding-like beta-propeller repeat protein [Jiangella alkaliphila]SDU72779.1 PQQ-like domain-containing protein [Jiangella alkaliphila]